MIVLKLLVAGLTIQINRLNIICIYIQKQTIISIIDYAFWTDSENYRRISDIVRIVKKCLWIILIWCTCVQSGLSTNDYTQKQ